MFLTILSPSVVTWVKVNGQWTVGRPWVKVAGQWEDGISRIRATGQWN